MEARPPSPDGRQADPEPETIGAYRILDLLGEGGMGSVYLAEQREPVRRRVAIKVIKLGMDSKDVVARFLQERQALALMDHDGIAKIHDCGLTGRGQPYFVMEYVKGVPLAEFCDKHQLSLARRLELMQQVCDAVQHAHQKSVVHRDLKPGNVLVSDQAGQMRAKIIDFGLAKALGSKLVDQTLFTEFGRVLGTVGYMAPEQADPDNAEVDTRADVYSLGVMLYELLVGVLPFARKDLRRLDAVEMVRMLREEDPQRPSARLSALKESSTAIAAERRTTPKALHKALRTDLDWIVLRALEKDRNRRYPTADALGADLQRYLRNEPVEAGPPSATYHIGKLLRRYRVQALAVAAVVITAVVGGLVSVYFAVEAANFADRIAAPAALARAKRSILRADLPPPAWPSTLATFDEWLDGARELLSSRAAFRRRSSLLPAGESETATGATGAAGTYADAVDAEQAQTIAELLPLLTELEQRIPAMERSRQWASLMAGSLAEHPRAGASWDRVRQTLRDADGSVVSAAYRDQQIDLTGENVVGLVPIGIDPATKLWEFYDLRSAWDGIRRPDALPIPTYVDDRGTLEVSGETGIVFVLVPGGEFLMGAQRLHADRPNFDPEADDDEGPPNRVRLDAFLISRCELTRGQWRRLMADPEPVALEQRARERLPKADIDWFHARECLRRHGMTLPTEAQWEYSCRGGTTTPWWCGDSPTDLRGVGNVQAEGLLPVGSLRANAFGLYDVHGNVLEWCADLVSHYDQPARPGDGQRASAEVNCVLRGGLFSNPANVARSAYRTTGFPPTAVDGGIGIRPARRLRH